MGTPDFAVPTLKKISEQGHTISLVVTQPDRPKGRGKKPAFSPVKQTALALDLPIVQPHNIKSPEWVKSFADLKPDVMVVVAYGQILPKSLLDIPAYCAVNIHGSLLPKYRGPAPIQWAIINGEKKTGVCTMIMSPGLDKGDILLCRETPISLEDTAESLHDRLAQLGADLLIETLDKLATRQIQPIPQDHNSATYAPMLNKKDGRIQWHASAKNIFNFIRGMTPWPGAFTFHGDKRLKLFSAMVLDTPVSAEPGTVISGFPEELRIATGDGAISITEIQGASGKRMAIADFLRGYDIPAGDMLT